jgi:dephospho-CoA kinase
MLLVALTGGYWIGKVVGRGVFGVTWSSVVVDSDQLARDVVERGEPAFDEIVERIRR